MSLTNQPFFGTPKRSSEPINKGSAGDVKFLKWPAFLLIFHIFGRFPFTLGRIARRLPDP